MIALLFMVCMEGSPCMPVLRNRLFDTVDECKIEGRKLILYAKEKEAEGAIPPQTTSFECVSFDTKA